MHNFMRWGSGDVGTSRIRVPERIAKDDTVTVNAIITHPMDTGYFRTPAGEPIPAYFIKDVRITYGDEQVARFTWTSGISRDPVISFSLKADRAAPLAITWTDSKGASYSNSVAIAFATA